jgi:hypothetical protein
VLASAMCAEGWHLSGAGHACCAEHETGGHAEHDADAAHNEHTPREARAGHCPDSVEAPAAGGARDTLAAAEIQGRADSACAHCSGRREDRPAQLSARGAGHATRADEARSQHTHRPFIVAPHAPAASFRPREGSPPGGVSGRRLLLNVFLI